MKNSVTVSRPGWALALALGLIVIAPATRAAHEPDVQRYLEGKLNPTLHGVSIDNRFGSVTVTGVDQDFGWRWALGCSGDKAKAEAYAKNCRLEVAETNGMLQIRFVPPEHSSVNIGRSSAWHFFGLSWASLRSGMDVDSNLELRLPRAVTVVLKNRFGPVTVVGIRGSLDLDCQNSPIDVANITGPVTAATSFAPLRVARTGSAQLRSLNGEIQVAHIAGDLRATASFGRLKAQDVKGRAEIKNQNGDIDASDIAGDLVAASSFGRINVRAVTGGAVLRNQNGAIDARHIHGSLVAESSFGELRVEDVGGTATLKCQNGRIDARRVGGAVTASNSFARLLLEDAHRDAILESKNGEIVARDVSGSVQAETSFGRLQLDGDAKRFEARNQNGAVQITARSPAVERITATTSFGPIDVSLPRGCKPRIHAKTSFGKVHSDFPVVLSDTLPAGAPNAAAQLKVTLHGQNGDIRVQGLASQ